jgi:hexosaminidase
VGELDIADAPRVAFRAVHLDVARRWYEPEVVERLIDVAAWRKLNHVHLHLTDDEAWRFDVDGYPALAAVGGTRGHGLALPPLCGSGPGPYGRAYTDNEIARWVERAGELGISLIPEVDVPAHCHAALVAVPELRDPDDASTAASVQGYPNNVLVPGLATTMPFLEAVFTTLSRLFPDSPTLHIGGDEVPAGAWSGSPAARAYADERGLSTTGEIQTAFHRDLVDMIRSTTGRDVAMWEEAALAGVEPSGYAVAWTSPDAGARLTGAGHRVVMAPGQAYYLDMAPGRAWERPGGSWAGNVTLADVCDFDPFAGGNGNDDIEPHGIQACIWGEHIADLDILDALVFPRLDAIAERAWSGRVVGGHLDLRARSAHLPRFTR